MPRPTDDQLLEAYEAWDPDKESVEDLCRRNLVSKDVLYRLLRDRGVVPKSRRSGDTAASLAELIGSLADVVARLEAVVTKLERKTK